MARDISHRAKVCTCNFCQPDQKVPETQRFPGLFPFGESWRCPLFAADSRGLSASRLCRRQYVPAATKCCENACAAPWCAQAFSAFAAHGGGLVAKSRPAGGVSSS